MRLVLVPGFSLTALSWSAVVADLPNQVEAMPVPVPTGMDFTTTAAAIGREGGSAVYAGYSMGGRLALQLALDSPGVVEALVLISATAGIRDSGRREQRRQADDELASWILANGTPAFVDRWLAQPIFTNLDPAVGRAHRIQDADLIADQLRQLGQGVQSPLWERLSEIKVPVAIVAGERDGRYQAIARETAFAIGRNARVHVVANGGHALVMEQPGAVAELLAGFVDAHSSSSSSP